MRLRSAPRLFFTAAVFLGLLTGSLRAEEKPVQSPIHAQHAKLAERAGKELALLFKEARKKELGSAADELAQQLLHFQEDHGDARAWLGYQRIGDTWSQPETLTQHSGSNAKALPAFQKRLTKKLQSIERAYWRMLDKAPADLGTEARDFAYEDLAVLARDSERLARERTVELKDGHWLTLEASRALKRWYLWQDHKKERAKKTPPPKDIALHPMLEDVPGLDWAARVEVAGVKVWGTCSREDAAHIANYAIGAAQIFAEVFGLEYRIPKDLGFIVVEDDIQRKLLAKGLRLGGMRQHWPAYDIPNTSIFVTARWQGWPVRMDTALRFMLHRLYVEAFGWTAPCEWAAQGVSVLLSAMTKPTFYTVMGWDETGATELDRALQAVLFKANANWGAPARDLINEGRLPTVAQLEPQSRREIWVTDLLACYTYAYYFVVVHNEKASSFYARLGKGQSAADAIQAEFGWTMDEFEARVARWLNDYRGYVEGKSRRVSVRGVLPRRLQSR